MSEFSDDIVEIPGVHDEGTPARAPAEGASSLTGRPWVGIRFDCCGVYHRIYRNREGTAYTGRCPRCARRVTLKVGPGGTDARFFAAD